MKNLHAFCAVALATITQVPVYSAAEKTEPQTAPGGLILKAYNQIRGNDFAQATKTLCASIRTEGDSLTARRYLSYVLLQQGLAEEALKQIPTLNNPSAFDLFLKGVAFEMNSEPATAVDWFRAAVEKEPQNAYFRNKAIEALIGQSKYDDAATLCEDGIKIATDPNVKTFYIEKLKKARAQSAWVATAAAAKPVKSKPLHTAIR